MSGLHDFLDHGGIVFNAPGRNVESLAHAKVFECIQNAGHAHIRVVAEHGQGAVAHVAVVGVIEVHQALAVNGAGHAGRATGIVRPGDGIFIDDHKSSRTEDGVAGRKAGLRESRPARKQLTRRAGVRRLSIINRAPGPGSSPRTCLRGKYPRWRSAGRRQRDKRRGRESG